MSKGFKWCCPALELACSRANDNQRTGIQTGSMMSTSGNRASWRTSVVIYFPKAKKTDESKYGFKSEFKNTVYGLCKFCPFCGTRLEPEEKSKEAAGKSGVAAASRPSRKRARRVGGTGAEPGPVQSAE